MLVGGRENNVGVLVVISLELGANDLHVFWLSPLSPPASLAADWFGILVPVH